jgi:RsiW-degrading membrane proteinase PrsW (M82 family)
MQLFIVITALIILAAGLALFFLYEDRGEREPIGALWMAFGLGILAALVDAIIENIIIPKDINTTTVTSTILFSSLTIGIIEEASKFIPLSLFIYTKRYFNEHTDGIIYFALAGLGFGLLENINYAMNFGASTGLRRLMLTPFFHAAITCLVGYALIRTKLDKRSHLMVLLALITAMLIHGIYDFGIFTGKAPFVIISIAITLALTMIMFWLYFKSAVQDQDVGLSAVGHTNYCRYCGHVNKDHYLYCTHCGLRV